MFIALVLFATIDDPVRRVLKPALAMARVPGRVECRTDSAEPEATAL